ncbi:response regulator transcription factor [Xanthovirga aplysinae]|uniref:response regulator transcription factor n=1 Tax=Xanthovirga aplysinae TaxID=2529853 RepID=UPI0012BCCBFA|nr:response regulator transcription factor [Xanthovirga aplysinae]MTI33411.1 response regulator transcription factor [Xanthovirga aplysinae]
MESSANYKVLVVDDEPDILEILEYNLQKEDFKVRTADNGKDAIKIAQEFVPDLILLDIMMPEQDGVETCRLLREIPEFSNTLILFLTARTEEYSEVAAFDAGADDYITKPIKPRALISRLNALFRRKSLTTVKGDRIIAGDLHIDRSSFIVTFKGKEFQLPKKEFELLSFFAQNPNRVFNREELLQNIWGTDVYVLARTVDVHIRKLREKIGEGYIVTVKGVGYKFELA